jgi:hypothetical protein
MEAFGVLINFDFGVLTVRVPTPSPILLCKDFIEHAELFVKYVMKKNYFENFCLNIGVARTEIYDYCGNLRSIFKSLLEN